MIVRFGLELDRLLPTKPQTKLGYVTAGPGALLSILETQLGLPGSSVPLRRCTRGRGARSVLLIGPSEVVGSTSAAQLLASHYDESRNATAMDADPEWTEFAQRSIEPLRALEKRSQTKILYEVGSLRVTQGRLAESYFNLSPGSARPQQNSASGSSA